MNYLDIIISIFLLYGLIKGFSNGLIKEITLLVSLFLGVYVGVNFAEYLEPKIAETFSIKEDIGGVLAFVMLFLVTALAIRLLGKLIDKITKFLALGFISSLLGAIFGFFKMIILFVFLFYLTLEYHIINTKTQKESVCFTPLKEVAVFIIPQIKDHNLILKNIEKKSEEVKEQIQEKINSQ